MSGSVKSIVFDRGFGFIAVPGERDVFFHANDLERTTFDEQLVGLRVEFAVEQTTKGARARHVQPARD